jgi:hypothetical protein
LPTPAFIAESQKQQNRPAELYMIFLDQVTLYYTPHPVNVTFFNESGVSQVYTPFAVERSSVKINMSSMANSVTLKFGNVDLTMGALAAYSEFEGRRCRIIQVYLDILNDPGNFKYVFDGRMHVPSGGNQINDEEFTIEVVSPIGLSGFTVPREGYQRNCNIDEFGSSMCGVNKGIVSGTVTSIDPTHTILTLSGRTEAADWFKDGVLTIASEKKKIIASNGALITVEYPFETAEVNDAYSMRRGCDKTFETCNTRFNNLVNFRGFRSVPTEKITILK